MMVEGKRLHEVPDAHMVFRFRVFWPLVFAVLLTYYLEGKAGLHKLFGAYKVWRVPGKWYAFSISWKFLFCYLGWAIADIAGILPWPGAAQPMFTEGPNGERMHIINLLFGMPFIIGIALVEETTWMKYCATRLQDKYTAFTSCFITGIIWGLWYLPMLLLGEGVPDGIPWYMFLLSMVGLALLLGWVYNMTHSGLILLFMQLVSNIAFYIMPALPVAHDGDASWVKVFVWVEVAIAAFVVIRYGYKDMGLGPRPTWTDPQIPGDEPVKKVSLPTAIPAT
jgi:membrane protease YdiL (CAAX protease family)